MENLSKEDLLDEVISMFERSKGDYTLSALNLDTRKFRNRLLQSELMPVWAVEECVAKLHDFLLDFREVK